MYFCHSQLVWFDFICLLWVLSSDFFWESLLTRLCALQMRSIAAESDRAYNGGPLDGNYYQHSSFTPLEAGLVQEGTDFAALLASVKVDAQYANHLDWFAVDLEGEHSAMDGWILEEHSEYVVQAVHRVRNFTIKRYFSGSFPVKHVISRCNCQAFMPYVCLNGGNTYLVGGEKYPGQEISVKYLNIPKGDGPSS